jgi:hypothetical protein
VNRLRVNDCHGYILAEIEKIIIFYFALFPVSLYPHLLQRGPGVDNSLICRKLSGVDVTVKVSLLSYKATIKGRCGIIRGCFAARDTAGLL